MFFEPESWSGLRSSKAIASSLDMYSPSYRSPAPQFPGRVTPAWLALVARLTFRTRG